LVDHASFMVSSLVTAFLHAQSSLYIVAGNHLCHTTYNTVHFATLYMDFISQYWLYVAA